MLMFFAVQYLKAEKKFFLSNIASQQKSLTNMIEITTFVLRMIPIFLTFFWHAQKILKDTTETSVFTSSPVIFTNVSY